MMDAYTHLDLSTPDPLADLRQRLREAGATRALAIETWDGLNRPHLDSILSGEGTSLRAALCYRNQSPRELAELLRNPRLAALRWKASNVAGPSQALEALAQSGRWLLIHSDEGVAAMRRNLEIALNRQPGLKVFVPHFGWPRTGGVDDEGWQDAMQALSRHANVVAGLSAVEHFSREEFPHRDLYRLAARLLAWFGPDRIVAGTDYPNCARCNYGASLLLVHRWILEADPAWSDTNALSVD